MNLLSAIHGEHVIVAVQLVDIYGFTGKSTSKKRIDSTGNL